MALESVLSEWYIDKISVAFLRLMISVFSPKFNGFLLQIKSDGRI